MVTFRVWLNRIIRWLVARGQAIGQWVTGETAVIILSRDITPTQTADLQTRLAFYAPALAAGGVRVVARVGWREVWHKRPLLLFDTSDRLPRWVQKWRSGVFDIDYRRNPRDGWEWCDLAAYAVSPFLMGRGRTRTNTDEGALLLSTQQTFAHRVAQLHQEGLNKCYLFGTGPSLAAASERDWNDGYRVVCNTIVRDAALWHHLAPHFIVAGDGIYHFGHTPFAHAFRRDLLARLRESDTLFIYPARFDPIVRRELAEVANRLIPIPIGRHRHIHADLTQQFALPNLGNVLPLLLLPLGCTLAQEVGLWGFDGRAPDDKLFWQNSNRHSYPELLPTLQAAHPTFFSHNVPQADPTRYVRAVHGDVLEVALSEAESAGWCFTMLHHSWTETLRKRMG